MELPEVSPFYDGELGQATKQINRLLQALAEQKPPDVEPSVIIVEGGPFLAWTQPSRVGPDEDGAIGPDDHPDTILLALQLNSEGAAKHKRSWVMIDTKVWCYANNKADCIVGKFWESLDVAAGSFHDDDLADATTEVNAILDKLREAKDPGNGPSFILVENSLLLIRTEPGIGPDDDPRIIRQALGLND